MSIAFGFEDGYDDADAVGFDSGEAVSVGGAEADGHSAA